ncbi:hypothetical protein ACS0TY_002307 [Phlomoides rotata]
MAEEPPHHHHLEDHPNMAHADEKKLHKEHVPSAASPKYRRGNAVDRRRSLSLFIAILLILAGITALTVWLVYRPHKPKFRVVSAALYELNTTAPPFVTATMQFTVATRNPNRRVSFHYDHLTAFVSYREQAITPPVTLPPLVHETKSTVALSPLLGGAAVPVEAEAGNALIMEENYGVVNLRLVLMGKLRYKGGAVKSRRHGVYVRCDILVGLKTGFVGQLPLLRSPPCYVDV